MCEEILCDVEIFWFHRNIVYVSLYDVKYFNGAVEFIVVGFK